MPKKEDMLGCRVMALDKWMGQCDKFCPLAPWGSSNQQSFKKFLKKNRNIMILHQGTKNYDHMFGCRVMAWRDEPFWTNFCHPSGNSKNSIFKKSLKNALLLK